MDLFPVPEWLSVNSSIAHQINSMTGSQTKIFNFMSPSPQSKALCEYFDLDFIEVMRLDLYQYWSCFRHFISSLQVLNQKSDLFQLSINDVQIGIDIYESILRTGVPTVNLKSIETYKKIYLALRQFVFFERLFLNNRIHSLVLSHDSYIGPGLAGRMAHRFEVPVIQANIFEINILQHSFQNYERFGRYPEYFSSLPIKQRERAVLSGMQNIERRLGGEVNIERDGRHISSLDSKRKLPRQLSNSESTKILVLTHDFYDNPHAYSILPFLDFMEWLEFLGSVARESDHEWYIKCHPDSSGTELLIVKEFLKRNGAFRLVDSLCSFQQLSEEGLKFATTCYGSVGSELPLLGITVANAAWNPHVAYSFNLHAKNLQEYRRILENIEEYRISDISLVELSEFVYVHRMLMSPDDFSLPSARDYLRESHGDPMSIEAFRYIESTQETISQKIQKHFLDALKYKRIFSVEKCLPFDDQSRISEFGNYSNFYNSFNL
jgi:hypothetical protein